MTKRRAHGIDMSTYQRDFDKNLVSADDLEFVVLKATQDDWADAGFEKLIEETSDIPIRGAYHYYATRTRNSTKLLSNTDDLKKQRSQDLNKAKDAKKKAKDYFKKAEKRAKKANTKTRDFLEADKTKAKKKLKRAEKEYDRINNKIKVFDMESEVWVNVYYNQIKRITKSSTDWTTQANKFIDKISGNGLDFFALDLEGGPNIDVYIGQSNNVFTKNDLADIFKWMAYVASETGKPVLIYTGASQYGELVKLDTDDKLKDWKLWLAAYELGDRETTNPIRETKRYNVKRPESDWTFWQYSADKNGQGVNYGLPFDRNNPTRGIDLNVFNGTLNELRKWLGMDPDALPPEKPDDKGQVGTGEEPEDKDQNKPVDIMGTDTEDKETPSDIEIQTEEPTYPDMDNQGVLNLISKAANNSGWWKDWVVKAGLESLAANDEARLKKYTGPKFENLTGLSDSQKQALLSQLPGYEPPTTDPEDPGHWVKVDAAKTNCKHFKKQNGTDERDGKLKPIMKSLDPNVQLKKGQKVRVSSIHSESSLDKKDGVIMASGGKFYYLILEAPDNPRAVQTFVLKDDTRKTN